MSNVDVLMLGEVFAPRARYVNPPDPSRGGRLLSDVVLGDLGAADDYPYDPDFSPAEAAMRCLEAGGEWEDATQQCSFPDDDPAVKCAAGGGAWDPVEQECVMPDGLPPGFVAPGPTTIAIGAWDTDHEPYALYEIKYGDTYVGLAKTYLDRSGVRWREIWNLNRTQHPNPDQIWVGQRINMPAEARDNYLRWLNKGQPGTLPSEDPRGTSSSTSSKLWWAIGGVAVVGAGALAWKKWGRR